ncbi:MAG: methyltransferase, TIGR04325 family [Lentisphaerae bacterium]|jgi:putative methyltransferase (TIGR04325 family)|nr:methyltransferase, TIGR04325 family [Lentisphaerota bacterium]MBT4815916.1 methyltransferase, TIGR04325 family [Lentisphaerota bacterium]MBT5611609.1 methyltransferase, TIGR04325 family [Lentisphaerota bacterium]MBT7061708.1 methyltransferase, TIGR04325 family [Lentisphaerota bacterium]MBT7846554.1 methyltransferase, TIGR04325 family [Lentisphaerota bacterium]
MTLRECLKQCLPPALLALLQRCRRSYGFFGNYESWAEASEEAVGYDSAEILARVEAATIDVAEGRAPAERDSVLLDEIPYSWPVLATLLRAAGANGNRLCVLDFGGALGSSYFHCREFLSPLDSLRWHVVEQPHTVASGRRCLVDQPLRFFDTIDDALAESPADVLLLSSVLQYLPDPAAFLRDAAARRFPYILIDRMPFSSGSPRLTVQRVHPDIYPGSYPAWLLDVDTVRQELAPVYDEQAIFDCDERASGVAYRGMIWALSGAASRGSTEL